MYRAIIIDDDNGRSLTGSLLTQNCPTVQIVGGANGVESGVELIREKKPDCLFLDLILKDGTGFDLLDFFPKPFFKTIITCVKNDFALRALKYHVLDYLTKPVDAKELILAVDSLGSQNPKVKGDKPFQIGDDRIMLNIKEGLVFIQLDKIIYLAADSCYTTFHLATGEQRVIAKTLKDFEDLLPSKQFFRIHQSYIINMTKSKRILKEDGTNYVEMENGCKIPIARRKKEDFFEWIQGKKRE